MSDPIDSSSRRSRARGFRIFGWLAAASMLAVALLGSAGGVIHGVSGAGNHKVGTEGCGTGLPVQLMPYANTPNNGTEYSVDFAPKADVDACEGFDADSTTLNFIKDCSVSSKNDNFKVR